MSLLRSHLQTASKVVILPAPGQEHGFFDENGARQQDVPAASDVVRAEREKRRHQYGMN